MTVAQFLEKYGFVTQLDMEKICGVYLSEMKKGLCGRKSSLAMLPAFLSPMCGNRNGRKCVVIDAGGTNLRAGIVSFGENGFALDNFKETRIPGSNGEISADVFFDFIARFIYDLCGGAEDVGFCFSYPAVIDENVDATVMSMTKEVKIRGIEGRKVAQSLAEALSRLDKKCNEKDLDCLKSVGGCHSEENTSCVDISDNGKGERKACAFDGDRKRKIAVLNDTVAVLMGGCVSFGKEIETEASVGLVFGTGVNVCYVERVSEIEKFHGECDVCDKKNYDTSYCDKNACDEKSCNLNNVSCEDKEMLGVEDYCVSDKNIRIEGGAEFPAKENRLGKSMVINVEAGNFDKFPRSTFDNEVIAESETGEAYVFEKMTSSRYLGKIAAKAFYCAANEGLISFVPDDEFLSSVDTVMINEFVCGEKNALYRYFDSKEDRNIISEIISAIIKRSANMCAAMISAAVMKSDPRNEFPQSAVFAEGSAFHLLKGFKEELGSAVNAFFDAMTGGKKKVVFLSGENTIYAGSALAVLSLVEK